MKVNRKRKIAIITLLMVVSSILFPSLNIFAHNIPRRKFSTNIEDIKSDVPSLYRDLKALKRKYPNWNFQLFNTGWDWNSFINVQTENPTRSLVESWNFKRRGKAWVDLNYANKSYDTYKEKGRWKKASRSAVEYFVDPRTYLNETDIFALLNTDPKYDRKLSVNEEKKIVSKILKGTKFEPHVNLIVKVIMEENASSAEIAGSLKQENGPWVNPLNIGTSGNGTKNVIEAGLNYAKKNGWTNFEKGLRGGIRNVARGYENSGQTTKHSKKFNYINDQTWNQYMQNIEAPMQEGISKRNGILANDPTLKKYQYYFLIPIFNNMPKEESKSPDLLGTSGKAKLNPGEIKAEVSVAEGIKFRSEPNLKYSTVKGVLNRGTIIILEEEIKNVANMDKKYIWYRFRNLEGKKAYIAIGPKNKSESWIKILETRKKETKTEPIKPKEDKKVDIKYTEKKYHKNENATVNVEKGYTLRFRNLPNTKYGVILSELPRGKKIKVISKVNLEKPDGYLWYKVIVDGQTGFLSMGQSEKDEYIKFAEKPVFEEEYQKILEKKKAEEEAKRKAKEEAERKAIEEAERRKKEEEEKKKKTEEEKAAELARQAKNIEIKKGKFKKAVEVEIVTPYGLYIRDNAKFDGRIVKALLKTEKIKISESLGIIPNDKGEKYLWFKVDSEDEMYISKGILADSEYFKILDQIEYEDDKKENSENKENPEKPQENTKEEIKEEENIETPEVEKTRDILGNNKDVFKSEYKGNKYISVIYNINLDEIKKLGNFEILNRNNLKIADSKNLSEEDLATGNILKLNGEKYKIIRKGDINGDGIIDIRDANEIMNARYGEKLSTIEKAAARLNMEESYEQTISSPVNIQNTRSFKILLKEVLNK